MALRKIVTILLISNALFVWSLSAQELFIETKIDTNLITIGDQVKLSYKLTVSKDLKVEFPVFTELLSDGIEIIGQPTVDSTEKDKQHKQITIDLLITSFDTGYYQIPHQKFVVHGPFSADTAYSRSLYLGVTGVAIDTTGTIRDIKAPIIPRIGFAELLPYLIIIIVLVLAFFLLRYFRNKKSGNKEIKPDNISEPPHITALRELDKIKAQKLWQQKQVKEYYTRVTYVIRWYISKRFSIMALEQTSDEILDHLRSLKIDQINYQNLESLLNLADLVKFAKGEPNPDENIIHLDNAYDFIKKTKIEWEPATELSDKTAVKHEMINHFALSQKIRNSKGMSDEGILNELNSGGKLVHYEFCISIIVYTFRRSSRLYLIRADENAVIRGVVYSFITFLMGWWGIPWGPILSFKVLVINFKGGISISVESLIQKN